MPLATLTTGHYIGMSVVAVIFVGFALVCSFVLPRRRPDFPGKAGIGVFAIVCIALFAAQLTSVLAFGVEKSEAKSSKAAAAPAGGAGHTIAVQEKEFKIVLPALKTLAAGSYTFAVQNVGKIPHNLVVQGPNANAKTALIAPGASAKLTVALASGSYKLYCSVPGHAQLGMVAKLSVG